jgi:hypothetical protein
LGAATLIPAKADVELLTWRDGPAVATVDQVSTAAAQLKLNLEVDPTCDNSIVFAKTGNAVVGLYVGSEIRKTTAAPIVQGYIDLLKNLGSATQFSAQICGPKGKRSAAHVFGIMADLQGNITNVHSALGTWANGDCLTGAETSDLESWKGQEFSIIPAIAFTMGPDVKVDTNRNSTMGISNSSSPANSNSDASKQVLDTLERRGDCRAVTVDPGEGCWQVATEKCGISTQDFYNYNGGGSSAFCDLIKAGQKMCCSPGTVPAPKPQPDGTCQYVQAQPQDTCWSIANTRCGEVISVDDLVKYNNGASVDAFCALKPKQPVCCSPGKIPDLRPKPNADGTCASHTVGSEYCWDIQQLFLLNEGDVEKFNKGKTWGWAGCEKLQPNMNICISDGRPPLPAVRPEAVCGPQVKGTQQPTNGTKLADLNPCPLNSCCDAWVRSSLCLYISPSLCVVFARVKPS